MSFGSPRQAGRSLPISRAEIDAAAADAVAASPAIARVDPGTAGSAGQYIVRGPSGPAWLDEPVFNVKHPRFGAKGDGETDDTAAIKAALQDTAIRGGILYFPAGFYLISEALPVHPLLSVQGEGDVLTEIKQMNPNANCFEGTDIMWLSISNITIDGPGSGTGNGIVLTRDQNAATNYIFMDRVTVQHFGNDGISISNCIVSTFNMVHSRENGRHGWNLYGVSGGSAGTSVQLTVCYANENGAAGFLIDTMTYCQFSTCVGEKNGVDWDIRHCYSMNFAACGVEWTIPRGGSYDGVAFRIHQCLGLTFQAPYILLGAKVGFLITGGSSNIMLIAPQEIDPQVGMEASIRVDAGSFATILDYNVVTPMDLADSSTTVLTPDGSLKLRNVVEFGMGNNLYAVNEFGFATDSHFTAWGGIATRVDHEGAPDEEFAEGTLVVDDVNERLYVRVNDAWHYIDIDDGAGGGTPGQRGNKWFVSGGSDGFTDYTDVTGMISGDIFLYPNSGDLFQYNGTAWVYAGAMS